MGRRKKHTSELGKVCPRCQKFKSFSNFALSKKGYQCYCRLCNELYFRSPEYLENRRLYEQSRQSDPQRQVAKRQHRKAYNLRNPLKVRAWHVLHYAIDRGEVVRGVCEVCGSTEVHAHHEDYSKPLKVHWLCRAHHRELSYS
jgi:hypothetical protein